MGFADFEYIINTILYLLHLVVFIPNERFFITMKVRNVHIQIFRLEWYHIIKVRWRKSRRGTNAVNNTYWKITQIQSAIALHIVQVEDIRWCAWIYIKERLKFCLHCAKTFQPNTLGITCSVCHITAGERW